MRLGGNYGTPGGGVDADIIANLYFGIEVGRARQRLGIEDPAVSGDEFDRYFRAHQNSLEQLIIFFTGRFSNRLFGLLHYLCRLRCLLFVGQSDLFPQLRQRAQKGPWVLFLSFFSSVILIMTSLVSSLLILL